MALNSLVTHSPSHQLILVRPSHHPPPYEAIDLEVTGNYKPPVAGTWLNNLLGYSGGRIGLHFLSSS